MYPTETDVRGAVPDAQHGEGRHRDRDLVAEPGDRPSTDQQPELAFAQHRQGRPSHRGLPPSAKARARAGSGATGFPGDGLVIVGAGSGFLVRDVLRTWVMDESPEVTGRPGLERRLGFGDAVIIGLGSMIGAGVFAVFAPAAKAAGTGLLAGLVLAAVIAYCNAVSSARLAAVYPRSGGTYVYGRERLGAWWGFAAGWGFVIGKTASCAAMALTFASYAVPGPWWAQRLVALAGVAGLAGLNYRGVTRTAALTRVLVACTLVALTVVVAGIWLGGGATTARLGAGPGVGVYGVLQAAGLLFFAFAGYARVATLGEEVRDPARTIPRAIPVALFGTVGVYLIVGFSALAAAGPVRLGDAAAPLTTAVHAA
ncbi:MAG: APC family permease, partial [Actinoallomurus sp.]